MRNYSTNQTFIWTSITSLAKIILQNAIMVVYYLMYPWTIFLKENCAKKAEYTRLRLSNWLKYLLEPSAAQI